MRKSTNKSTNRHCPTRHTLRLYAVHPKQTDKDKATIRFKNPGLKAEYQRLVDEAGRHISLNALLEMALEEALPAMRQKVKQLRK